MLSLSRLPDCMCSRTIHVLPAGGRLQGGVSLERSGSGALKGSLLVSRFFLNRHAFSMTQRTSKIEGGMNSGAPPKARTITNRELAR